MIEPIMFFGIGFLVAALVGLVVAVPSTTAAWRSLSFLLFIRAPYV